ncbi:hypothetical protein MAR_014065 [Mya arenaria]|uniref:Uncharacterized protein n=2 Tax=Mya arenaria TaxID=6604 RepID=A0ABY7GAX4_MYAAR|nr:hypothetical protein MAR_014038 [Mya arenaria]WAR28361.1 hypothetical protein MAR_014065 [Mya arenaria]
MLDVLALRGAGVYERFCEVLYTSGHAFIADFLKDEENASADTIDCRDVHKRIPVIEKTFKEQDRKTLELYINEKVKEAMLKGIWSKEAVAREKDKAIEAKQRQLEDAFAYEEKEKAFKFQIAALEKQLAESRGVVMDLKSQIGVMGSKLRETEDKFKADFSVQLKYNSANENALQRLEDKLKRSDLTLNSLENSMKKLVSIPRRNSERDQMALADFKFAFIQEDFELLVEKFNSFKALEKQNEQLIHERNYILSHLGHHSNDNKPTLLNAYRDFAVRTDEDMVTLKQKLEQHLNTIEGQQEKIQNLNKEVETQSEQKKMKQAGTVWQNALLNVMRKQLNDVKQENRKKETQIKHSEAEIAKLKARVGELETARRHESHTHQHHLYSPSSPSRMGDAESDGAVARADKSRKNSLLPPLANNNNKGMYQVQTLKSPQSKSPNRQKSSSKPVVTQRGMWERNVALPEGLITSQLRLENRGMEYPTTHLGQPPRSLGEVKMNPGAKHNKYAHVRI